MTETVLFDSGVSVDYRNIVTHLGQCFPKEIAEVTADEDLSHYSIFKDFDEVRQRYQDPVLIGQGGMKKVFRVYDRVMGREVALAVMHGLAAESLIASFIAEARITARLTHPGIMPVYDIGIDEKGEPFFTMKLARGETLGKIIARLKHGDAECATKYPSDELLEVFIKICDVVAYAHHNGILHLDLKPDNVQVCEFGEVLVCDWGLSRCLTAVSTDEAGTATSPPSIWTRRGEINGSPGYMSPEQITLPRTHITSASDVFSLGVILYEILTLKRPFTGSTTEEILAATVNRRLIRPRRAAPDRLVPPALEAVCLKAMDRSIEGRYRDVEALKREMVTYRRGYPTMAENAGLTRSLTLMLSRNSILVLVSAVATALIIMATVLGIIVAHAKTKEISSQTRVADARHAELVRVQRDEVAPFKRLQAETMYRGLNVEAARQLLAEALQYDPENPESSKLLGFIHLGEGEFQQAIGYFSQARYSEYVALCERLLKRGAAEPESRSETALAVVRKLQADGDNATVTRFVDAEIQEINELQAKLRFVHQVLSVLNPAAATIYMDCVVSKDGTSVALSFAGTPTLENISGLGALPVSSLDLTETRVVNLAPINQAGIKSLHLSATEVTELADMSFPELELISLSRINQSDLHFLKSHSGLRRVTLPDSPHYRKLVNEADLPDTMAIEYVK